MTTAITNYLGQTYSIGSRVRHSDGWTGTVTGIRETQTVDLLLVNPDPGSVLCGYDKERPLNAEASARLGRGTSCRPRDQGLSMGNYTPILPEDNKAAAAAFQAAEDAWQAELEEAFPDAHEARYLPRGKGKDGTPLRAAYEAREAARVAWEAAR